MCLEKEREERDKGWNYFGDRFIFRPYSSIACSFVTKFNPTTVEGIKCTVGHFFLSKIKIFAFKMIRNRLLTFWSMNASTSLDRKLTLCLMSREFLELFCLVLRLFQVQLHIYVQVHCIALLYLLTGMVIVESYLVRHFVLNWSSQLEALIVREQLWSIDPCHYSLLLIQRWNARQ